MRISDWSSDVCSSDLSQRRLIRLSRAVIGIQSNERRRRVIVHRGTEGGDAEPATLACEVREKAAFLLGELYRDDVKGDLLISVTILRHSRSEEHTSELQSLMRISYAVFCLKKKTVQQKKLTRASTIQ